MALSCGSRVLINTGECSKSISNAAVRALESDEISASGGIMIGLAVRSLPTCHHDLPLGYYIHRKDRGLLHSCLYHTLRQPLLITHKQILGLARRSKHVRSISYITQQRSSSKPVCTSRGVHDVAHKIAAVGSRSVEKAQDFIDKCARGDKSIKAYGTYDEVYADKVIFSHNNHSI